MSATLLPGCTVFGSALPTVFCPPDRTRLSTECGTRRTFRSDRALLEEKGEEIAAIIVEPIVQGAAGMCIYRPEYLEGLSAAFVDEYGCLLIFDEIATGFGRVSSLRTYYTKIKPDIITLGKALTGGYMTFAVTCTTKRIADIICGGETGCFMHGPTFMGNALLPRLSPSLRSSCSFQDWAGRVSRIEEPREGLAEAADLKTVKEVRTLGAIGVVR